MNGISNRKRGILTSSTAKQWSSHLPGVRRPREPLALCKFSPQTFISLSLSLLGGESSLSTFSIRVNQAYFHKREELYSLDPESNPSISTSWQTFAIYHLVYGWCDACGPSPFYTISSLLNGREISWVLLSLHLLGMLAWGSMGIVIGHSVAPRPHPPLDAHWSHRIASHA